MAGSLRFSTASLVASLLLSAPAFGADIPVKAPTIVATVFSWTGCHVGVVGGYQWGSSNQAYGGLVNGVPNNFLPVGFRMAGDYPVSGGQLGGTAGCNLQVGRLVFGVEGDASWVNATGRAKATTEAIALGLNPNFVFTTSQLFQGTARGRVGFTVTDRLLVYATGGAAFGRFELNNHNITGVATAVRTASRHNKTGWVAGGGLEWSFADNWSLKGEGLYVDYGTIHYGDEPGIQNNCTAGCANANVRMREIVARIGLNWRWFTR